MFGDAATAWRDDVELEISIRAEGDLVCIGLVGTVGPSGAAQLTRSVAAMIEEGWRRFEVAYPHSATPGEDPAVIGEIRRMVEHSGGSLTWVRKTPGAPATAMVTLTAALEELGAGELFASL